MRRLRLAFTPGVCFRLLLPAALLAVTLAGCDKTGSTNPIASNTDGLPTINVDSLPSFWVYQSEMMRPVRVKLDMSRWDLDAVLSGQRPAPEVAARIYPLSAPQSEGRLLRLYDDGGNTLIPSDSLGFEGQRSGDVVPNDLIYSARINSHFAPEEGNYRIVIAAGELTGTLFDPDSTGPSGDPARYVTVSDTLQVFNNTPPEILSFSMPDSLPSGFDDQVWVAEVSDPNESGGDHVSKVELTLQLGDGSPRTILFADAGNHVWHFAATAAFAAGYPTGSYSYSLTGIDLFDQVSPPRTGTVWIENTAPMLSDAVAPDTVYVPAAGANLYKMYVTVDDPQGHGDIQNVYYEVDDPLNRHFTNPDFTFGDEGEDPDSLAGDGRWTAGLSVPSTNQNYGTYIFTFFARDRANNVSEPDTVRIVMIASSSRPQ